MTSPGTIRAVARYEARLLWRSWAFRLSALVAVGFLLLFNILLAAPFTGAPHLFRAFSGAMPLTSVKLLNLYLGLVGALLATEFVKRDRQLDSAQTVFVNSYTNVDYLVGKMLGIGSALGSLVLIALAAVAVTHRFFVDLPFAWQPYLLFPLFGTLPTLAFTIGLACLLVTVLRSQALVLVLMLGLSALTFLLGVNKLFFSFDTFAFWIPLIYSDFVGLGNLEQLLYVRGTHLLLGLACMGLTALLSSRLRQSMTANAVAGLLTVGCLGGAAWASVTYVGERWEDREARERLVALSQAAGDAAVGSVTACSLYVEHRGHRLAAVADLRVVNRNGAALDSLLFCLNPGLAITEVAVDGVGVPIHRDEHLLWVVPPVALAPRDSCRVRIAYAGTIDERAAYLDIDPERFEGPYRFWLFRAPKAYAFVTPEFLHLTPETTWYPVSGLPPGAAFPSAGHVDYTRYRLSLRVPDGWTAFSQGETSIDSTEAGLVYHFRSDVPLPQVSLTAGPYEIRRIAVDDVAYALAVLPGHTYFDTYLDSLDSALPGLIREMRNDYEASLGLDYPYPRLSLVEVPLQFFAYRRLWTLAQESVQPEIVFLPEMGTLCEACDFRILKRVSRWSQESANQAETAEKLQSEYLRTFVEVDLLGTRDAGWSQVRESQTVETRFRLLPNCLSFATHLSSDRWPVLNAALESYFQARLTPPQNTWARKWTGLTETERANVALKEHSLEQLLADPEELDDRIRETAIRAKSRQLLLMFAAAVGPERFARELNGFVGEHRNRALSEAELTRFLAALGGDDPEERIDSWFNSTELPGYQVEDADAYLVRDGERTRTQVEVDIANPTAVDGVVEVGLRLRQSETEAWFTRNSGSDVRRTIALSAGTRKKVGFLLDGRVAEMIVDTHVSRNLPAQIQVPLPEARLRRQAEPFDGERVQPLAPDTAGGEYVVDNEDDGFEVMEAARPNWLRRLVVDVFDLKERDIPYVGFHLRRASGTWEPTTDPGFYGRFVLSGYYKKAGDGRSRVSWRTEIDAGGEYDLYYYFGQLEELRKQRHPSRSQELNFLVYHEDGVESSTLDMVTAEDGWNLLGTYPLAAGPAHVELSDRGPERAVVADAVKWVRRN